MIVLNAGGILLPLFLCSAFAAKDNEPVTTRNKTDVIRVKTLLHPPYMMIRSEPEDDSSTGPLRGNARFHGYLADILREWGERTDTEYHITVVRDGQYGTRAESGEWSGIIGELIGGQADVGAAAVVMTPMRKLDVDFTDSWASVSWTMVMRRDLYIASPEELLESGIIFGVVHAGTDQAAFQHSEDAVYSAMWAQMASVNGSMVSSYNEGIRRAKEGNYIFIMKNETAAFVSHANCSLKMVGSFLPTKEGYGFPVRKGSPPGLLESLNEALSNMTTAGTLERLHTEWWKFGTCGTELVRCKTLMTLLAVFLALFFKHL